MAGPDSTATDIIKLLIPKADKSLSSPTRSLSASAKKLNVEPVPRIAENITLSIIILFLSAYNSTSYSEG